MVTDNAYYRKITDKKRQAVIVRSEIERFTSKALKCVERMPFSGDIKERYRQLAMALGGRTK